MSYIRAFNISDAWTYAVIECWRRGFDYTVAQGSFVGHTRRQLPSLILEISRAGHRPFTPFAPAGFVVPFDEDSIAAYAAQYILSPEVQPSEEYTYGNRIHEGINRVIKMLNRAPRTNQAIIEVARPDDTYDVDGGGGLPDPPCLRLIDWKVYDDKLNLTVYFRSWDIYSALVTNLGGIQILNEFISGETGLPLGTVTAISTGAHIYDYAFDLASSLAEYYRIVKL